MNLMRRGQQAELEVGLVGYDLLVTMISQLNSSVPGVPATTNETSSIFTPGMCYDAQLIAPVTHFESLGG